MPFQTGNNLNPNGRPKTTPEQRTIKHLNTHEFVVMFNEVRKLLVGEAKKISKDPDGYTLEYAAIVRIFLRIVSSGDMIQYDRLLNRILGKVPEVVHQVDGNSDRLQALLDRLKVEGIE